PGTSFEYVAAVTGEADGWSGWGIQWGDGCANANVTVTAGDAGSVTATSLTPGCDEVLGCMDENAANYDAAATEQAYDQYGNLGCVYASCADVPEYGCIYADSFGAFNDEFGADLCESYGGTPCEEPTDEILGCVDENASNYDADATEQDYDQYGNLKCVYTSCADVPEYGCIYVDGFGAFSDEFGADLCVTYGGTPCEEATETVLGCMDANASNYDAAATEQAVDQYGNLGCIYASCDDVPEDGCIYLDAFGAFNDTFNADLCVTYGGTPCADTGDPVTTATVQFTVDMNGVDQPSEAYSSVVVNGSWNGWGGWGVELADEDEDGVYTGELEIAPGTSFEYVAAVTGEADGWSGWGIQWGDGCANANVTVTAGDAGSVTATSLTPGCADVLGCVDANASNFDAAATTQAYDQYGNLGCVYASCADVPQDGCIYADAFGAFNGSFGADLCVTYGGTPCEDTGNSGGEETVLLQFSFDSAEDLDDWNEVGDAVLPEANMSLNEDNGNPAGSLQLSGENQSEAGRAYIFEYSNDSFDYAGASQVTVTFDAKNVGTLLGAALHLQVEAPGAGVINIYDLQAQGLNDASWTSFSVNVSGITDNGILRMHFNMAAGAFSGAGGTVLIDNILVSAQ
ncbi:MAG: hypothetical protein HOK97_23760, partial [Deltaproteobacteria bacterium]|nr:hypothetical protein [Deltaproteobacteria bacterium]